MQQIYSRTPMPKYDNLVACFYNIFTKNTCGGLFLFLFALFAISFLLYFLLLWKLVSSLVWDLCCFFENGICLQFLWQKMKNFLKHFGRWVLWERIIDTRNSRSIKNLKGKLKIFCTEITVKELFFFGNYDIR